MTIEMPDELRDAIVLLRQKRHVHSDSAVVRLVVAEACKVEGIPVPEDVIGPGPGTRRQVSKKGAKSAAKPTR